MYSNGYASAYKWQTTALRLFLFCWSSQTHNSIAHPHSNEPETDYCKLIIAYTHSEIKPIKQKSRQLSAYSTRKKKLRVHVFVGTIAERYAEDFLRMPFTVKLLARSTLSLTGSYAASVCTKNRVKISHRHLRLKCLCRGYILCLHMYLCVCVCMCML